MESLYAGVDLGGTTVSCALGNAEGQIVCDRKIDTESHRGPQVVLQRIAQTVATLASEADASLAGVGMGVPGLADIDAGIVRFLPNLPTNWRDIAAGPTLTEKLGCPVHLLNDVRIATLGELAYGRGAGVGTMAFFALGTGIGGGIAIDGELRLGPLGAAGELGHQTVLPDGPLCGCGNRGCLETLASGPALTAEGVRLLHSGLAPKLHELVAGSASGVSPKQMAEAAHAGDAAVLDAIRRAAEFLAIGVANVVVTLHPDLIVLGGGVAQMGEILLEPLRSAVRRRVRMIPTDDLRIEQSTLGNRAGVLGGVALAVRHADPAL
jgi:glucokinase